MERVDRELWQTTQVDIELYGGEDGMSADHTGAKWWYG
jgi:hypothetical protein